MIFFLFKVRSTLNINQTINTYLYLLIPFFYLNWLEIIEFHLFSLCAREKFRWLFDPLLYLPSVHLMYFSIISHHYHYWGLMWRLVEKIFLPLRATWLKVVQCGAQKKNSLTKFYNIILWLNVLVKKKLVHIETHFATFNHKMIF